ncbi:hypothetical protein K2173_013201 [Erythroxylum novogranatense]|uniref:OVATE domain-containing protein n=1 Tax=Erythroxylum novogranatense TaxID=1862640 RepID=A0AAV8SCL4_9ROSI|nr:hypothetical protein K2173_013201 [Erythroxylum novogranatense]
MLLKNPISNTKIFFQKTYQGFKSFFSGGRYEKLRKIPPSNGQHGYSTASFDMNAQIGFSNNDKFYSDLTNQSDTDPNEKEKNRNKKKATASNQRSKPAHPEELVDDDYLSGRITNLSKPSFVKNYHTPRKENYTGENIREEKKRTKGYHESTTKGTAREGRIWWVAQKIKELEMMDVSNVDHILDVEEVLHYYSRLTCSAYLEIVDRFLMDMYAEFSGPPAAVTPSTSNVNSRPRLAC